MKIERARIIVRGAVQGVGFRPFVYRLATALDLQGWVLNSNGGVLIEVEGCSSFIERFCLRLELEKPPCASIHGMETTILDPIGYKGFEIRYSDETGAKTALITPDIATCPDCLREILDPANRRYRYPFTNCTNCGPRFSIIEALPYDRKNTSMKSFTMCLDCDEEYHNPVNRRFHAQPNACPNCGPQLEIWLASSAPSDVPTVLFKEDDALRAVAQAIRNGQIVAMKGIGGFQFLVDARNDASVRQLRDRKQREEKPFAVMLSSIDAARAQCQVSQLEEQLLTSPEAPIVLLQRKPLYMGDVIAPSVAPANPWLGVMLPYSPLHHLLMRDLGFPIIATSGNLVGEPICVDEFDAWSRLSGIADLFLVHNRPIVRQLDDSISRVICGRSQILRRARGFAPLPILMGKSIQRNSPCSVPEETSSKGENPLNILAVGAHLKNVVALATDNKIFLSQHIGDLETEPACRVFQKAGNDLENLYEAKPAIIACDLHPEYLSTKFAHALCSQTVRVPGNARTLVSVQHHHAHILACAAENEIEAPLLGLAWDGTGFGLDGNIWGGEFLLLEGTSFKRIAHIREFRLPGGETAIKHPSRSALGLLWEILGEELFESHWLHPTQCHSSNQLSMIQRMLARRINSPLTTSMGRLFDAVASLIGLCRKSSFEGQAAMQLEFAAQSVQTNKAYTLRLKENFSSALILDWQPMIEELLDDVRNNHTTGWIAAKFHNALAEAAVMVARLVNISRVALSGGCFQNKYLTERTIARLQAEGFRPYWHQHVPPNDGGIALGQVAAVLRHIESSKGYRATSETSGLPNRKIITIETHADLLTEA